RLAHGGDGLEAARRIREATDIPIIFCTAYGNGLRSELTSVSGVQLVSKPVQPSSLQAALAAVADKVAVEGGRGGGLAMSRRRLALSLGNIIRRMASPLISPCQRSYDCYL